MTSTEPERRLATIHESPPRSTAAGITLESLASADTMTEFFQARLPRIYPGRLTVLKCRPGVLKKRLGSSQVISYTLTLWNARDRTTRSVEVIGKRYRDDAMGGRAFRTMQALRKRGFGDGSQLNIPKPLAYFPDLRLLVQEKARGTLLSDYLGRGDVAALAHMRTTARWLAKLHRLQAIPGGLRPCGDDEAAMRHFARRLGTRYPHAAPWLEHLASAIGQRIASFTGVAPSTVHGDFHPENIFVTWHGATVIDFDHFCTSDPARDVGHIIAQMRTMAHPSNGSSATSGRDVGAFVKAYLGEMPADEREGLRGRIAAFAARAYLEGMYYVLDVLQSPRSELLSHGVVEIERFIQVCAATDFQRHVA